ncbi:MAG: PEGA domain-containing protein [Lachnospirales bacterium]
MKKKNVYIYIVALVVAVIVCIIMMIVAFIAVSNKGKTNTTKGIEVQSPSPLPSEETNLTESEETDQLPTEKFVGLIGKVHSRSIEFYDITNDESVLLSYESNIEVRDKYGQIQQVTEIEVGSIVDVTYHPEGKDIKSLCENPMAWESKNVTGIENNSINNVFTIKNSTYRYDENLIMVGGDDLGIYSTEDITEMDTVDLRGYSSNIYFINIVSGHGRIAFNNLGNIENGTVEIDTTTTLSLANDFTEMPLATGKHNVVVKGDNIEPYVKVIDIKANATEIIDLNEVQTKKGLVAITANVSSPTIYIDDIVVNLNEPLLLEYGEHTVYAEKSGYIPYKGVFEIKSERTEVNVTLENDMEVVELTKVIVETEPEGAEIYIDSAYVGVSPAEYSVVYGSHTILAKKEGYADMSLSIKTSEKEQKYLVILQNSVSADTSPTPTQLPEPTPTLIPTPTMPTPTQTLTPEPTNDISMSTEVVTEDATNLEVDDTGDFLQ